MTKFPGNYGFGDKSLMENFIFQTVSGFQVSDSTPPRKLIFEWIMDAWNKLGEGIYEII